MAILNELFLEPSTSSAQDTCSHHCSLVLLWTSSNSSKSSRTLTLLLGLVFHEGPLLPVCPGAVPPFYLQHTVRRSPWLVAGICCPSSNGLPALAFPVCEGPGDPSACTRHAQRPLGWSPSFSGAVVVAAHPLNCFNSFLCLSTSYLFVFFWICFKIILSIQLDNMYLRRML